MKYHYDYDKITLRYCQIPRPNTSKKYILWPNVLIPFSSSLSFSILKKAPWTKCFPSLPLLLTLFLKWAAGFEWQIHGNDNIFSALHYDGRGKVAAHLILNWAWFAHSDLFNPGQSGRPWKSAFDIRFYPIYHRLSFIIQPTVPPGYRGCSNICLSIHWSSICWNEMGLKKDLCCLFHSKRLLLWISISLQTFGSPEDFSERSKAFLYIDVIDVFLLGIWNLNKSCAFLFYLTCLWLLYI